MNCKKCNGRMVVGKLKSFTIYVGAKVFDPDVYICADCGNIELRIVDKKEFERLKKIVDNN